MACIYLVCKILQADCDVKIKLNTLHQLLSSNVTLEDNKALLQFAVSWVQNANPSYCWLSDVGFCILDYLFEEHCDLVHQAFPDCAETIVGARGDKDMLTAILVSLPNCDRALCVEHVMVEQLFRLFAQHPHNDNVYDLVLAVQWFPIELNRLIVEFICWSLAQERVNLSELKVTKARVDRVVVFAQHWLNSVPSCKNDRQKLIATEVYILLISNRLSGASDPSDPLSQKMRLDSAPSSTVSALLSLLNMPLVVTNLNLLSATKLSSTVNVLTRWLLEWTFEQDNIMVLLWLCLEKMAAEQHVQNLIDLSVTLLPQFIPRLHIPATRANVCHLMTFLLVATNSSPKPLELIASRLGSTVAMITKTLNICDPMVRNLLELGGVCRMLANKYPHLKPKIITIFSALPLPDLNQVMALLSERQWSSVLSPLVDISQLVEAAKDSVVEPISTLDLDTRPLLRGLINLGNTCYMNSCIQVLFHTLRFRNAVLLNKITSPQTQQMNYELQKIFSRLQFSVWPNIRLSATSQTTLRPSTFTPGHQEDSSEFLAHVLNHLSEEEKVGDSPPPPPLATATSKHQEPSGRLKRWITEENLSGSEDTFQDQRKARSLATFGCCNDEPATAAASSSSADLSGQCCESKDSGIHSVGSMDEDQEPEESLVESVFGGQQVITFTCSTCSHQHHSTEQFLELQLSLPSCEGPRTVQELVTFFLEPESLTGENQYECRRCNSLRDAKKSVTISKAPQHLILTIKMFKFDPLVKQVTKLTTLVRCGDTLVLGDTEYHLYSMVLHSGVSTHTGHYHAQVFSEELGSWVRISDEESRRIPQRTCEGSETPYILFFKQKNLEPVAPLNFAELDPELQQTVITDNNKAISLTPSTRSQQQQQQPPPPPPPSGGGCGDSFASQCRPYLF